MQKTAYEMRISDWSSDVCSSDLLVGLTAAAGVEDAPVRFDDVRAVVCRVAEPVMLPAREDADRAPEGLQHRVCGRPRDDAVELAVLVCKRSEESRDGKEGVSTCRSRGLPPN